jgi:hypothetical protein
MLIKKLETSKNLSPVESADIAIIAREVKQHGFYSAYCAHLIQDIDHHDLLISEIKKMAARVKLRVTFNAEESICIFED